MNRIMVSGNLVRDAELRYTPSGTAVAEFRIGIRDDMLKKRENRTVFIDVVLFGQRAEALHKYLMKGKSLMVEGRLDIRINKNQDGRTFTNIQVYANTLEFLGTGKRTEGAEQAEEVPAEEAAQEPEPQSEPPEDAQ